MVEICGGKVYYIVQTDVIDAGIEIEESCKLLPLSWE